ncbi:MAG: hypothetical protein SFX72_11740 [Isosphaeraceae bacterium]|nr:hypothetical protein [Isosphaeraceae bacterium]
MSLESARAAYPLLVNLAKELSLAARERRPMIWVSYDELCQRCKEVGVNETPRTIVTKLLKPIQALCLEKGMPDLSALIIAKPKARTDSGNLHKPSDSWWEPYIAQNLSTAGDIPFWFKAFQTARDADWPETPFF